MVGDHLAPGVAVLLGQDRVDTGRRQVREHQRRRTAVVVAQAEYAGAVDLDHLRRRGKEWAELAPDGEQVLERLQQRLRVLGLVLDVEVLVAERSLRDHRVDQLDRLRV